MLLAAYLKILTQGLPSVVKLLIALPSLNRPSVDMLVHEVLIHRELPIIEGVRSPETVTSMRAYYTVSDQVRKIAKKLVPER